MKYNDCWSKELSFFHKLKFSIPISLQPDSVNLFLTEFIVCNIKDLQSGCKDVGIKNVDISTMYKVPNQMKFYNLKENANDKST